MLDNPLRVGVPFQVTSSRFWSDRVVVVNGHRGILGVSDGDVGGCDCVVVITVVAIGLLLAVFMVLLL